MKKYNIIEKKTGNLLISFIVYNKKIENTMLKHINKLKKVVNICEVEKYEEKRC